ncbi:MAG: hypothetical protein PHY31_09780, partial [Smithellaceae bacterium]|nr:hypothetical protein [Smithellaceae bacterium]
VETIFQAQRKNDLPYGGQMDFDEELEFDLYAEKLDQYLGIVSNVIANEGEGALQRNRKGKWQKHPVLFKVYRELFPAGDLKSVARG